MSYILAHGCSYTNKNYTSYVDPDVTVDWLFWPELLGIDLNCDVVNLGSNGHGNHRICMETVDYLFEAEENPKAVFVLLSGWDRHHILEMVNFNPSNEIGSLYADISEKHITHDQVELRKILGEGFDYTHSLEDKTHIRHLKLKIAMMKYQIEGTYPIRPSDIIDYNLRSLGYLYTVCDHMNIPLFVMQGLTPTGFYAMKNRVEKYIEHIEKSNNRSLDLFDGNKFIKLLTQNPHFINIDDRKDIPIGWPFFPEVGGYFVDHLIGLLDREEGKDYDNSQYRISLLDRHPNGNGQILIKKYFLKSYKDRING